MLGRVTREHEDVAVIYDVAEEKNVRSLLESLGHVVAGLALALTFYT